MANKIQIRRGLKSKLPTLSSGELAFTTDTRETFVGTDSGNVNMSGSHWYRGTAMSGTVTTTGYYSFSACPRVKVDDIYLNISNGNIYACTTAGSGTTAKWTYVGCIKGATGATGATGGAGRDKQAVYSTTPTQVGTWINGSAIYRIVWSFTNAECKSNIGYGQYNLYDMPHCPSQVENCSNIINERYICMAYSGSENAVVADRGRLKELVESSQYTNLSFTIYAVVEYIAA